MSSDQLPDDIAVQLRAWADDLAARVPPYQPAGGHHLEPSHPIRRIAPWLAAGLIAASLVAIVVVARNDRDEQLGAAVSTSPSTEVGPTVPSSSSPTTSVGPTTTSVTDNEPVVRVQLSPGAWSGARTSADGRQLMLFVIGAPEYQRDDPCSAAYDAQVDETDTDVRVGILGTRPIGDQICPAVGIFRTITASLSKPLGDRTVTVLGEQRAVFDGTSLVEVTFVPDGWQAGREGPGYPDPQTSQYWSRSWAPTTVPGRGEACRPSTSGLTLTEGSTDIVDRFPVEMGETTVSSFGINGVSAVYSTQTDHGIARLSWRTGSRGFVLKASPACAGDVPPSIETMLQFARGLVDHSPTAIAIPGVSVSNTDPAITSWTLDGTDVASMEVPDDYRIDPALAQLSDRDMANGLLVLHRWHPAGSPTIAALSIQRDPADGSFENVGPVYRTVETSVTTWKLVDFGEGDRTMVVGFAVIGGYVLEISGDDQTVERLARTVTVRPDAA